MSAPSPMTLNAICRYSAMAVAALLSRALHWPAPCARGLIADSPIYTISWMASGATSAMTRTRARRVFAWSTTPLSKTAPPWRKSCTAFAWTRTRPRPARAASSIRPCWRAGSACRSPWNWKCWKIKRLQPSTARYWAGSCAICKTVLFALAVENSTAWARFAPSRSTFKSMPLPLPVSALGHRRACSARKPRLSLQSLKNSIIQGKAAPAALKAPIVPRRSPKQHWMPCKKTVLSRKRSKNYRCGFSGIRWAR